MTSLDLNSLPASALLLYQQGVACLQAQTLLHWPRFANYSNFDKFLILNLSILVLYIIFTWIASFSPKAIYLRVVRVIFQSSFAQKELNKNLVKLRAELHEIFAKDNIRPELSEIPYKAPNLNIDDKSEKKSLEGRLSGSRYAVKKHCDFVTDLAKSYSYTNPLHVQMFPHLKQMEIEVIEMTANILKLKTKKNLSCGTFNSGGTESIIMAILAYREFGMKNKGINKPNLVICSTGHIAAHKACDYLNIECRVVKCDKELKMDLNDTKNNIDSQTIAVYTSYPNYPYGTIDPIDTIAAFCKKKDIPVHIDMCLGGFVAPFLDKNWKIPQGVTSISADPHKYGLSAKGASVLLYSDEKYRKSQYFIASYWPGGLYGTQGIAGSRSGVYIVAAWISMMKIGVKGYEENAKILKQSTLKLSSELKKLGFYVYGDPQLSVIAFKHTKYSVNSVESFMKERGWSFPLNQRPLCMHYSLTPINCSTINEMLKDFQACMQFCEKQPITKESGTIELYGACAKIPDQGTKFTLLQNLIDCFIDIE